MLYNILDSKLEFVRKEWVCKIIEDVVMVYLRFCVSVLYYYVFVNCKDSILCLNFLSKK